MRCWNIEIGFLDSTTCSLDMFGVLGMLSVYLDVLGS